MALVDVQRQLAAILLEPRSRAAFAQDPAGYLASTDLQPRDRRLLARLDPDDVAYFAERRNIDRHQALRADAPRAVRALEAAHGRLNAYFRARPYALEDPRDEARAFAAWARAAARQGIVAAHVADLAAFDAAALLLSTRRPRAASPSAKPRRAPGVRVLASQHDLVRLLRVPDAEPVRRPVWLALHRTAHDVRWVRLDEAEFRLLRAATGRQSRATWLRRSGLPPPAARRKAAALVRDGLLAPQRR